MKTFDVCIIEDEQPGALALEQDIREYCPQAGIIHISDTLEKGIACIKKNTPDIVFLDIQLGRNKGFELFSYFPEPRFQTIIVTAYESFALQAIKARVVDYLLKPVAGIELRSAFNEAIFRLDTEKTALTRTYTDRIAIPSLTQINILETSSILYCSAKGNYSVIHLHNTQKITASSTLRQIEQKLDPEKFMRIHNSFLVSKQSIASFQHADGGRLQLINGDLIPVSKSYKNEVLAYLKQYMVK